MSRAAWRLLTVAPTQGTLLFGSPVDPQLVTVYQYLGAAVFGPLALYGPGATPESLIQRNEWLRKYDDLPFRSSLVFGWRPGFALYFGVVPELADPQGIQPVVYIEAMEELFSIPVASSIDRFFELYAHYLERMAVDSEYVHTGAPGLLFPWSIPELVAEDTALTEQVRAGNFDFLANNDPGALEWLQQLRAAPA